jgi:glycosyltransferase involved in cell wall biosynthesis
MNVKMISCWFATSYGSYTDGLRRALERRLGGEVGILATNCGCGDPAERRREFQDDRCEYFQRPHIKHYKSTNPLKYWLRTQVQQAMCWERARAFHGRDGNADVVHFQQILNATGSMTVFHWLTMPSHAARVVTVHELDPHQVDFPESNRTYNRADRVIVHCEDMKGHLVDYGVDASRIDVVQHGVELRPLPDGPRGGIVFYGGHTPHVGKGLHTLVQAMALVQDRLGARTPTLSIHGHWGPSTPEEGVRAAADAGVTARIRWLNQIAPEADLAEYRRARLCVIPFSGSFAGYPAGLALANGTPVIATRRAGVPDHVGDAARFFEVDDAAALAAAMVELDGDDAARAELAARGRARAESTLGWDTIAAKTLESYRCALEARGAAAA